MSKPHVVYMTAYFLTPDQPGLMRSWQVAKFLAEKGYRVTVLTTGTHYMTAKSAHGEGRKLFSRRMVDGVEVVESYALTNYRHSVLRRAGYSLTLSLSSFIAGLRIASPDIILAATPPPTTPLAGYILSKVRRAKFVYEVRDFQIEDAIAVGFLKPGLLTDSVLAMESLLYKAADKIVAVTPGIKRILAEKKGVPERQVVVVPNGYEPDVFASASFSRDVRKEFCWGDRFVVLYAGGLGQTYDIMTLVKVAHLLKENQDILFVIIGEGEKKQEYIEYCQMNGMDNCLFLPAQPRRDIPVFCKAADVCVNLFPKGDLWAHVLGNKIFDYLGSGTPVIYAGIGDTAEVIDESGGGLVVPPEDPKALHEAILFMRDHPEQRLEMGEKGKAYVVQHYSRPVLLQALTRTLDEVVGVA